MNKKPFPQLNKYRWEDPPWRCGFHINDYWEYVKLAVVGKTNKLAMVRGSK